MASFYSNSENERDTSAILQLREQMPNSYSEGLLSGNMMMYMNNYSSSAGLYTSALPVNTHQQTNCIAIMPGATDSSHSHQEILSQMGTSRIEGNVLNEWKDSRSNLMLMHQLENAAAAAGGVFQGTQNLQGQGLSLTLGTHVPSGFHMPSSFQNQSSEPGFSSIMCANQSLDGDGNGGRLGNVHSSTTNQESRSFDYMPHGGVQASNFDLMRSDVSPYGILSGNRPVPSPKYLKAAQELLDEVVNVKTPLKEQNIKSRLMKDSKENDGKTPIGGSDPNGSGSSPKQQEESSSNSTAELSASEKQELQNKLNKLLEMLDEVDRRYKQYYHQMQIVVSSFDIVAGGSGASKPYTALALQTISRHFRCLRDAITEQIQTARKSLGDQDASAINKGIGISRLRYIDQHIRQGRGIQQLGMMQQHAWRPQRGLPESSVSILRAWLFEHFLHPYPKDSDKMMLARQTGLSRSQVSNWFINAWVRLWKPMVEEMYKEELGDVEMDANSPSEFAANKATSSDAKACEDNRGDDLQQSTTSTSIKHPSNLQVFDPQSCHLSDAHWTESRIENTVMETENAYRLGKARQNMNDCNNMLLQDSTFVQSNESNDNRLMAAAYHISELGRFENGGSGVSLTLGLQQCEGGGSNVPMSIETHQNYATMRDCMYSTTTAPSVEGGEYDCLDSGNRHHRFSSSQLLHDFVAYELHLLSF